jgi:dihydropteroate synthase
MGIVNATPDSFADGGEHATVEAAIAHGLELAEEGADILDIGGESTRPGADDVSLDEELRRVVPVIEALAKRVLIPISVDTSKPEVMRAAVAAGAVELRGCVEHAAILCRRRACGSGRGTHGFSGTRARRFLRRESAS